MNQRDKVLCLYMYLIPRYMGEVENPRGGVRGVIPNKKIIKENYKWR